VIELWLLFAVATILCYGTAQQFSKRGVQIIGTYQTGIVYAVASVSIQSVFWLLHPDDVRGDFWDLLTAISAGIIGALGFVFYVFALKSGKVSIVSVITAGYPAVSIILAILLLNETLSGKELLGVMMVILAIILLSLPQREQFKSEKGSKSLMWLFWAVMSFIFWGIWAIPSKVAMQGLGESDYIFIDGLTMVLVWVPLWLTMEKGRMSRKLGELKYSGIAGILASIGTVSLFLAINNGQVSIVTPLTSIYPLITILLARLTLSERLNSLQYLAVASGIIGIVMLAS